MAGALGGGGGRGGGGEVSISKAFLGSLVKRVAAHNRREEEDGCWRMKRAMEVRSGESTEGLRKGKAGASAPRSENKTLVEEERAAWAKRKAQKVEEERLAGESTRSGEVQPPKKRKRKERDAKKKKKKKKKR